MRHGKGTWKRGMGSNIDRFDGEFKNDKKSGYGIYTWQSDNEYRGNYFDDLRHGYGEMYWTDGSYYKGQWDKGIQSGEGTLFVPGEGMI